ncbi:hypothetical protein M413DRAFT_23006 [Hebeloma cylindrosporum]|uniref:Uncharacterized protein n=1 Tax=Hebeloma cylindrosporum TaxID=76867 RepID=A0A0C3CRX7_HEBCY|nr:hypothetical protein M413DRAFT_23006 [Hebeloma cylindrosporum h7]
MALPQSDKHPAVRQLVRPSSPIDEAGRDPPPRSLLPPPSRVSIPVGPPGVRRSFRVVDISADEFPSTFPIQAPVLSSKRRRAPGKQSRTPTSSIKKPRNVKARKDPIQCPLSTAIPAPSSSLMTRSKTKARAILSENPPATHPSPRPLVTSSSFSASSPTDNMRAPLPNAVDKLPAPDLGGIQTSSPLKVPQSGVITALDPYWKGAIPQPCASCSSCAFIKASGLSIQCEFLGWGIKCPLCKLHNKNACTFKMNAAQVDQNIKPLPLLPDHSLRSLQFYLNRLEKAAHHARDMANIASRSSMVVDHLAGEVQRLVLYVASRLPPAPMSSRFTATDIIRALLNRDPTRRDLEQVDPKVIDLVLQVAEYYRSVPDVHLTVFPGP